MAAGTSFWHNNSQDRLSGQVFFMINGCLEYYKIIIDQSNYPTCPAKLSQNCHNAWKACNGFWGSEWFNLL